MILAKPPLHCSFLLKPSLTLYSRNRPFRTIATASNGENNTATNSDEATSPTDDTSTTTTKQSKRKLKVKSRRRKRNDDEEQLLTMASSGRGRREMEPKKKKWEEMTLQEKALELYLGEKGMLYWLNKFAYASIYIIIGGWILFRFVGPSLGLYQLDTPLLAPSDLLKEK